MKKYFGIFVAAMLLLGAASQAMAYFAGTTELVRVVFNRNGTVEVATDLGNINTLAATAPNANLAVGNGTAAFTVGQVTGAGSMADLFVAYFATDGITNAWIAGTSPILAGSRKGTSLNTGVESINTYYNSLGGTTGTVVGSHGVGNNTYTELFNQTTLGGYGNFVNQSTDLQFGTEVNLANLVAANGFTDQILYGFIGNANATIAPTGVAGVTIRTLVDANGNGYTVINPSAVPIPPSVLLFGSGLLGMIGIRRKIA